MNTYIYTLSGPDGAPRYVGKADDLIKRLHFHLAKSHLTRGISHKNNWIKSLLSHGEVPVIEAIDEVSVDEWRFWERYWYDYLRSCGFNLINDPSRLGLA